MSALVLLGFVALLVLTLVAFTYRGERELESERALLEQEDARDAPASTDAPARAEDGAALRELARRAHGFGLDHPITLRGLDHDAELPRVDGEQLREELVPWSELLQAFDTELDRLGSRTAGVAALLSVDEGEELAFLVSVAELRAVEPASRGDGMEAARLFSQDLRLLSLYEGPSNVSPLMYAQGAASRRFTVLQLLLTDRRPTRAELATLRESLGESPRFAEPAVLRRIWRIWRADFLSDRALQDTSPWMGAWRAAEDVRFVRRCSEISREPMDAALTAYESHVDCPRYDYERSAFIRTHHRMAEVALDLLIQLSDEGTLPDHGRVDPPQTDGSGVAVEYEWDQRILTVTPASSWAWPNRAVWQWRAPVDDAQAEVPIDTPAADSSHEAALPALER